MFALVLVLEAAFVGAMGFVSVTTALEVAAAASNYLGATAAAAESFDLAAAITLFFFVDVVVCDLGADGDDDSST